MVQIAEAELRERVSRIKWYHTMPLPYGIVTEGREACLTRWPRLGLPDRLDGLTVLDVGAWDGFFSFEAERRGAKRVVATDHFCWKKEGWGSKEGFNLTREVLTSQVEDVDIDVLDLSENVVGTFDVVLFLNVLYHLRNPSLGLERVASVTGDLLVLETFVDLLDTPMPALAYCPGGKMWGFETTWCAPNLLALEAMLKDVGFRSVDVKTRVSKRSRAAWAMWGEAKHGIPFERGMQQDWVVVHARK
jgi:tRNA (mo5U34)-methyltransferase